MAGFTVRQRPQSRQGRKNCSAVPTGTNFMLMTINPAINGWAIFSEAGFTTACRVMAKRLRDVCALPESRKSSTSRLRRSWCEASAVPDGTNQFELRSNPALKGWAIIGGQLGFAIWSQAFENSPAIDGWVHGSGMFQVPSGTKENRLPSLTGL